ncbi:MAG: hypothetical protein KKH94_01300 [Candidatus Omnitrophica bacterium]|nr:hypothetical protein [Candidatus Omnitrophota bacterium]
MKIKIDNVSSKTIKPKDRIEKSDIVALKDAVATIQNTFKIESKDYALLVKNLRAWTKSHEQKHIVNDVIHVAKEIRETFKPQAFVTIGIGGSDLGARTLHGALNHSQHNLLSPEERGGAPEVYFTGDTFDPSELYDILEALEKRDLLLKTIYNVISKSGTTSETIAAFLTIKDVLERKLKEKGQKKEEYSQYIVATTGLTEKSTLFKLNEKQKIKFRGLLPVPDGVGGRFSFASPVGLLFLAVTTNVKHESIEQRIASAIHGLRDAEACAYLDPLSPENVAANLAIVDLLAEKKHKGTLCFYPFSKKLRFIGDWYTQLSTESLQEKGQGQNVVATCGPTGNHSILNGIINGPKDKLIIFIKVDEYDRKKDFIIPKGSGIGGGLEVLEGKKFSFIQNASQLGTEINFTECGVPNVTISLPKIDTYAICKLMYTLECAVAFEGELRDIGRLTYEQAGVEGYKIETKRILNDAASA